MGLCFFRSVDGRLHVVVVNVGLVLDMNNLEDHFLQGTPAYGTLKAMTKDELQSAMGLLDIPFSYKDNKETLIQTLQDNWTDLEGHAVERGQPVQPASSDEEGDEALDCASLVRLNGQNLNQKGHNPYRLTLHIPSSTVVSFQVGFFFDEGSNGTDLVEMITVKSKGLINVHKCLLKCGDSFPPLYESIATYCNDGGDLLLVPKVKGGGKRAKATGASDTSGATNIVAGMSKDNAKEKIEDILGMSLMRVRNIPNISPVITETCRKVWDVVNQAKTDVFKMKIALHALSMKDLEKCQSITTVSTKVQDRCGVLSNILFGQDITNIKELENQTERVKSALALCVQFAGLA